MHWKLHIAFVIKPRGMYVSFTLRPRTCYDTEKEGSRSAYETVLQELCCSRPYEVSESKTY